MFYKKLIFILSALLFLAIHIQAQTMETSIIGVWSTEDGDSSQVEFEKDAEGLWHGTITSTDVTRSIGKLLFTEGTYNAEDNEIKGKLIHPDSGFRVNGTLSFEDNEQTLKVFAQKLFVFKTFYWKRL